MQATRPIRGLSSLPEDSERVEIALQDGGGVVAAQPLANRGRVNTPEVGGHLQVAVVQVGEAGRRAIETALDALPDEEHGRRRAVVGAQAAVLLDAAAE